MKLTKNVANILLSVRSKMGRVTYYLSELIATSLLFTIVKASKVTKKL